MWPWLRNLWATLTGGGGGAGSRPGAARVVVAGGACRFRKTRRFEVDGQTSEETLSYETASEPGKAFGEWLAFRECEEARP